MKAGLLTHASKFSRVIPAGQHDILTGLIAVAQDLHPAKAGHRIDKAGALRPTALESLSTLGWHGDMKQA